MKRPSEKQQRAANIISLRLGIPLPTEFTAKCYWEYISKHIDESKKAHIRQVAHTRQWSATKSKHNQDKWRKQRRADWEALHLDSPIWAQRVLDGKVMPPSWSHDSLPELQSRLRRCGYKSSMEEELECLREQQCKMNEWTAQANMYGIDI